MLSLYLSFLTIPHESSIATFLFRIVACLHYFDSVTLIFSLLLCVYKNSFRGLPTFDFLHCKLASVLHKSIHECSAH